MHTFVNLSRVDFVENLHENERIEHDGSVDHTIFIHTQIELEHDWSVVKDEKIGSDLQAHKKKLKWDTETPEKKLTWKIACPITIFHIPNEIKGSDLPSLARRKKRFNLEELKGKKGKNSSRFPLQQLIRWGLSGEGQGCHRIHDQVDPEELHSRQNTLTLSVRDRADEGQHNSGL